ncbi:MAG: EAL domain-containing protein, partial [Pseudomonadota bacterium]|nr:EAL domain-containing protein [Pseudomonadota bacterium]
AAQPGANTDTILRNADIAMYRPKDAARNQLSRYDPAMSVAQQERFQLEQSLRVAMETNAFRLAYQPIVSVETNEIVGYEALVRWTDPLRGEVSPALFIPIAETTGLILPLGRLILEWACFAAAGWPNTRTVAVNLSPAQFQDETLLDTIKDVLDRSKLAPSRLELEVTEGMLLENTQSVQDTMRALRDIGVSLTLDDFGTGHAGLSTLRRFSFQKIKIDRVFVSNLGINREADAIVEAMLLLSRRLNLSVVAEGVELETQLEHLRRLRCPFVQGYLTGRPQPPDALIEFDRSATVERSCASAL